MNLLHYSICLWISDSYELLFNAIVVRNLVFEIVSIEFITFVKGDLGRPRITQEPFLFCNIGYGGSSFITILVYFKPAGSRVNHSDTLANQVWLIFSPNLIWSN